MTESYSGASSDSATMRSPEFEPKATSKNAIYSTYLPAFVLALGTGIAVPAIPTLAKSFGVEFGAASGIITAFLLGMSLLLSVLASKAYYGNNKTFCGLMLVLASLHQPGQSPWMLRLQMVIVYFGAGLNKLLDPDWRSGVFWPSLLSARRPRPS